MTAQEIYDSLTDEQKAELLALLLANGGAHTNDVGSTGPGPKPKP